MTFGEELIIAEKRGIGIGNQLGHKEEKENIAMNMLKKGSDITFISEVTELSVEEIQKLKKA